MIFSKIHSFISSIILKVFCLLEFFLFLRLLLKFLGANPQTLVVDLIYQYSDVLVSPFDFIFRDYFWQGRIIEAATLSAMVGYAIATLTVIKLLRILAGLNGILRKI